MIILGINAFHADSSAVILVDGQLVAAVEEERFKRLKHWAGFPAESIRYCLEATGIGIGVVDHVAINQDSRANLGKKITYSLAHRPDMGMVLDRMRKKKSAPAYSNCSLPNSPTSRSMPNCIQWSIT